jgi:hypothetical protein
MCSIIALRRALPLRFRQKPGCWACQARVWPDPQAVLGGPVVDRVAGAEGELAGVRLGRVGLHLVDGRHHAELAVRNGEETGVVEAVCPHGRAEVPARLGGRRPERRSGLGQARQQRQAASHQHAQ